MIYCLFLCPQHYTKDADGLCTRLIKPKLMEGTVAAQDEFSRSKDTLSSLGTLAPMHTGTYCACVNILTHCPHKHEVDCRMYEHTIYRQSLQSPTMLHYHPSPKSINQHRVINLCVWGRLLSFTSSQGQSESSFTSVFVHSFLCTHLTQLILTLKKWEKINVEINQGLFSQMRDLSFKNWDSYYKQNLPSMWNSLLNMLTHLLSSLVVLLHWRLQLFFFFFISINVSFPFFLIHAFPWKLCNNSNWLCWLSSVLSLQAAGPWTERS